MIEITRRGFVQGLAGALSFLGLGGKVKASPPTVIVPPPGAMLPTVSEAVDKKFRLLEDQIGTRIRYRAHHTFSHTLSAETNKLLLRSQVCVHGELKGGSLAPPTSKQTVNLLITTFCREAMSPIRNVALGAGAVANLNVTKLDLNESLGDGGWLFTWEAEARTKVDRPKFTYKEMARAFGLK